MKSLLIVFTVAIVAMLMALPGMSTEAQSPTATPTRTPTLTNLQLIAIGTIVPPPQCGNVYVPCGALPYQVPPFPTLNLPSPTVITVYGYVPTLGATVTPGGSATATPQPTLDRPSLATMGAGMNNSVSTLAAQSTQLVVMQNGTAVSYGTLAASIGENAGAIVAYGKGFQDSFVNIGGTISLLLIILAFMVVLFLGTSLLSLIAWIGKFIMQLIETVTP